MFPLSVRHGSKPLLVLWAGGNRAGFRVHHRNPSNECVRVESIAGHCNGKLDVAEFIDWAIACGLEPVDAFREFLKRRR